VRSAADQAAADAKSAITMANAMSVAITMPTISLRCVASIEVAVVLPYQWLYTLTT